MLRSALGGVILGFWIIAFVCLSCSSATAMQKGTKPEKPVVVLKWDWTSVFDENDKVVEKGSFNVRGYAIYKGNKRIGTYEDVSKTQVKVEVSEGRLKGKLELSKEKESDNNWKGELAKEGGGKYKITVVFEKEKVIK